MLWRSYPITAAGPRWIFTTFPLGPSGRTPAIASYSLFNAGLNNLGQRKRYNRPVGHVSRKIRNLFDNTQNGAGKEVGEL